ncbi:MAG: hypothetical protein K0R63_292 [Rickettsiales bacterium]|jgi:signal transduction histidine kinase|nr:hypothetical protein [Rickettsiales bacterium]
MYELWMLMKKLLTAFLNKPVKFKLTMMVMLITSMSVILACIAFLKYDIESTKQGMIDELELVGEIIGKRTAPGMQFIGAENKEKAEENLRDLQSKTSVILACIYKEAGGVLASYIPNDSIACANTLPTLGIYTEGDYLIVHQLITAVNGKTVGSIFVKADMREVNKHVIQIIIGTFILMIVILLIAFALTQQLQKIISGPVNNLINTVHSITQNSDYSARAQVLYTDEIGQLADSFNFMMNEIDISQGQLEEMTNQLRHTNTNLERLVSDRTRDLQFTIERLEKANDDKNLWISNMTHEIRTPIHGMKMFSKFGVDALGWAIKGEKEADLKQYSSFFEKCHQAANRLNYLIEGILDLSKMNAGKMNFHYEECLIYDILRISHDELQHKWLPKNITVKFEPGDMPDFRITCDKNKMIQVVTNLLGNAIKFSPENGQITIRVTEKVHKFFNGNIDAIDVSITDQGMGIPAGEEEKIFETFVQSSKTYDGSGGTGLGLSISREIIRAHNGEVKAYNNPEGEPGCTFLFWVAKVPLSLANEPNA